MILLFGWPWSHSVARPTRGVWWSQYETVHTHTNNGCTAVQLLTIRSAARARAAAAPPAINRSTLVSKSDNTGIVLILNAGGPPPPTFFAARTKEEIRKLCAANLVEDSTCVSTVYTTLVCGFCRYWPCLLQPPLRPPRPRPTGAGARVVSPGDHARPVQRRCRLHGSDGPGVSTPLPL